MMRAVTISVAVIAAVAVLSGAVVGQQSSGSGSGSGSGSAVISTGISASTSVEPRSADFDADGDPEIAVVSGTGSIIIHDPQDGTTDREPTQGSVMEMGVADFDNDGEVEILYQDDRFFLNLFDTVDRTNAPTTIGTEDSFSLATVGDVFGDGGDDILVERFASTYRLIHIDFSSSSATSGFASAELIAGGQINSETRVIAAGDVTSAGGPDIEILSVDNQGGETVLSTVEDIPEQPSVNRGQYAIGNVTSGVSGAEVLYVNQSDLIAEAATGSTTTIATNVDTDGVLGVGDIGSQSDAAVFARNGQLAYKSVGGQLVNTSISVTGTGIAVGDFRGDADDDIAFIDGTGELAIYSEPEKLEIRNASSPDSLVTGATVDIRFFTDTGTVTTEQTSTGIIDLTNSPPPPNVPLLVRVDAPGFNSRELILPSLIRQQEVFLVPTSQSTIDVEFSLQDNTGRFPGPETDLILERPLNVSGQTTFTRIEAGDFGASGTKSVTLVPGQRYRVTVKNGDRTRELGPVTPTRPQVIPLEVGKLEFGVDNESTFAFNATRNADTLTAVYEDPDTATTRMTISFREINNESNVVATSTKTSTTGTFKFSHQLQGDARNDSYVARFEGARDGEQLNQTVVIGVDRFPLGTGLDEGWQQIFSVGLILVVGGLFSAGNARIGAIVVPAIGGILFYLGWLNGVAGASTVVLALALGAGYNLVTTRGVPT